MRYDEIIKVDEKFQTSVNLEYDLNNFNKIESYVPTDQSVKILNKYLRSVYYDNNDRATVLIGPYGRGKSHLLLILLAIISLDVTTIDEQSRKHAETVMERLITKINSVDKETGALAKEVLDSPKKLLPVIVNSNFYDINQSFIIAIKESLEKAGLQDLLPETYFDVAASVVKNWKSSIPDAYQKLTDELQKKKVNVDDLYIRLKKCDHKAYELFCLCYPRVAAGTRFNPLTNMDVIKLFDSVNNELCKKPNYSGLYIVFDEFSKFLEANLDKSRMLNFKIIQDMAESATRSGKMQLHLTCVTHKEILDYSSSDSFKTVEGRFQKVRFVETSEQSYELIANAIHKEPDYGNFILKYKEDFEKMMQQVHLTGIFGDLPSSIFEKILVYGCFPLAPITAYSLLRVSEKVAQNERTLFTFLAQKGTDTLASFIKEDIQAIHFMTVENIYGYFEEQFRKEIFNETVHSIWSKANAALKQIRDKSQAKIIKAIAIIGIVGDDRLKPLSTHIRAALLMEDDIFNKAITELMKSKILAQRTTADYVMLTANGVNIQNCVSDYIKTKINKVNSYEILNDVASLGYIIPREYNDKYCMLRYFKNIFMDVKSFLAICSARELINQYSFDGIVIYVINSGELYSEIVKKVATFENFPQIVVCVSNQEFNCDEMIKKILAIQNIKKLDEAIQDTHYRAELEIFEEDVKKGLVSAIEQCFAPNSEYSHFYNCNGEMLGITKQSQLIKEISRICLGCFDLTPIINNEMVNKNRLTTQVLKARNETVSWILKYADKQNIPLIVGNGPEASIFRSTIKGKGLNVSDQSDDPGMNMVLDEIRGFITSAENVRISFNTLYERLKNSPYGLRKGIIPIYIAYALNPHKSNIVFYYGDREEELNANMLSNLNDNPIKYHLLLEVGTNERDSYLDKIDKLFAEYRDNRTESINKVYRTVKSMQNWMRSLPEYTKKFTEIMSESQETYITPEAAFLRKELLKFDVNARELLFVSMVEVFSENGDLNECYQKISLYKQLFDSHILSFKKYLIQKTKKIINSNYQGTLSQALKCWYEGLKDNTKKHIFNTTTNMLLEFSSKLKNNDDNFVISELALIQSSMSIEDWSDALFKQFLLDIKFAVDKVNIHNDFTNDLISNNDCTILITYANEKIEKTFDNNEISSMGLTVYNNLEAAFDEYNDAIEPSEKLAILIKLMKDLI